MMSQTLPEHVPSRQRVERKLAAAEYQISMLESVAAATPDAPIAVESCAAAAIDQLLQALAAALDGFNRQLPDPLPALRVNRRNLRDHFYAVQADSRVLREIEAAARVQAGWLWWLEQKHSGGPFGPLIQVTRGEAGTEIALVRDPLNLEAGTEEAPVATYLRDALLCMSDLVVKIGEFAPEDVARYREASRGQWRRMI